MAKFPFDGWMVAAALGSALMAVVVFDAERVIDRLDAIEANTKSDHETVVLTKERIEALTPRVDGLEVKLYEHDTRLTKGGL
jgi:hypothetical protein